MAEPYDTDEPVAAAGVRFGEGAADPDLEGAARARRACASTWASRSRRVQRSGDGAFEVRTTVAAYRAQRVVLSIGTRGKPRTLQVPGENLPKIFSLLEDPDDVARQATCSSSAVVTRPCEAALALADAGAKVMISYRGKGFNRAAPKNKQTIERYAAEGRIKVKLGSQVLAVRCRLGDARARATARRSSIRTTPRSC